MIVGLFKLSIKQIIDSVPFAGRSTGAFVPVPMAA